MAVDLVQEGLVLRGGTQTRSHRGSTVRIFKNKKLPTFNCDFDTTSWPTQIPRQTSPSAAN